MLKGSLYLPDPLQADMSQLGPEPKQTVFHCGSFAPAQHHAEHTTPGLAPVCTQSHPRSPYTEWLQQRDMAWEKADFNTSEMD